MLSTNTAHRRNPSLYTKLAQIIVLILIMQPVLGACSLIPQGPLERAIAAIDDAIQDLNNASASWQQVLQDLSNKLVDAAQSTIRTEVQNTLNRAVGAAGAEFRCNVDF